MAKCGRVRVPEVRRANVTSVCRGGAACRVCGAVEVPCALLWVAIFYIKIKDIFIIYLKLLMHKY